MIRRIILENYMSHGRTVIEPAAGLTVLIGPNNCGKSAIIHALQTLCYNKPNEFAIRHDQKEASVTVETEDGHVLKWRRKRGGSASYEIDGEPTHRLGQGGVPEALHGLLRMPKIESADGQAVFLVHFGLQKSPIFLLDDPPARAATFFASSSDAERLLQMQRRHREKVRIARHELTGISRDIEGRDKTLAATVSLSEVNARVGELEASYTRIEKTGQQIETLSRHIERLKSARRLRELRAARAGTMQPLCPPPECLDLTPLQRLIAKVEAAQSRGHLKSRMAEVLVSLNPPPRPHETARLAASLRDLRRAFVRVDYRSRRASRLAPLAEPPSPPDLARLAMLLAALRQTSRRVELKSAADEALVPLGAPPGLADISALRSQIRDLRAASTECRRHAARVASLTRLDAPPGPPNTAGLQALVTRCEEFRGRIRIQSKILATLSAQSAAVRHQIVRWVEENPHCPLCGAATDADAVLAGGHSHER